MKLRRLTISARSVLTTGIAVGLSAIVIAATLTPGLPVTHVSANDGGVWLTSNAEATFARYVAPIGQIDAGFAPPGGFQNTYRLDILQQGTTVVAEDQAKADIYPVNVVQGAVDPGGASLPGGQRASVALGGSTLAVLDPLNGKLWAKDVATSTGSFFSSGEFSGAPTASIKGAKAIAVSQLGDVYVATSKALWTMPIDGSGFGQPASQAFPTAMLGSIQMTVVGTSPVVYDSTDLSVYLPDTQSTIRVPDDSTSESTVLQQVGPAASDVLLATSRSLVGIPLSGGSPALLASVSEGTPARPVFADGCSYGAWAGSPGQLVEGCGGPMTKSLLAGAPLATPVFRVNNNAVLLNDTATGDAWSVSQHPKLVVTQKNYQDLTQAKRGSTQNSKQTALINSRSEKPKAQNVVTEAHLGSIAILHLLDYASNPLGGPLTISSISPPIGPGYQAEIASNTQTVSLQIDPGVTNPIHFAYTVMNAKGYTATASVTVNPTTATGAPYLRHGFVAHQYAIASTATATYQVLSGWRDAQNDPLALLSANSSLGTVSWTGTGLVTLTAPTVTSDTPATVSYVVTNGVEQSTGVLHVEVLGAGTTQAVAPIAEPNVVQVTVGETVTDHPLSNNIPGADPLHPSASLALAGPLTAPTGVTVSTDLGTNTVSIKADQQGIFVLPYQVAFGSAPLASSEILVIARPPVGTADRPITAPASDLLHGDLASTVDVLAEDYDPSGGLLTVISATAPAGIDVAIIKGKWLRIESTAGFFSGWKLVSYEVTNGLSSPVEGVVAVAWTPLSNVSPPIAPPMKVQVLAGNYIDVRALNNAVDPSGAPMELVPGSVRVSPPSEGSAYVVGGIVRYAAPTTLASKGSSDPTVSYAVEDGFGNETTGTIQVTVLPPNRVPAIAPTPLNIDIRAIAGARVVIPVQTTGIDANGESTSVVGIVTPPQLGRILSMNATSITYQAYPNVAGTDTFSYSVENASGQEGTGTIRVGIIPPQGVTSVTATPVFATAAPGNRIAIDLLSSVIASPQSQVRIMPLHDTNASVAPGFVLHGSELYATAPSQGTSIELKYGVEDGVGPDSVSTVTVRGKAGYRSPPFAASYFPPIPAHGGRVLTVNVLRNSYNVGGVRRGLRLVRVFGADATIDGNSVRATVMAMPRDLAYEIVNAAGATAVGIIHLPGLADGVLSVENKTPIQVPLGGVKAVNINAYVKDTKGPVRLISDAGVVSSPGSGLASRAVNYDSVDLSDVGKYNGPGALMVQVTPDTTNTKAVVAGDFVSLPVQVGPAEPILSCPSTALELSQGGAPLSVALPSICQLWVPAGVDPASLKYQVTWKSQLASVGLATSDSGRQLQLDPGSLYQAGKVGVLDVSISGTTAHSLLYVSVAPAPLATMHPINVVGASDGHTTTVNIAQAISTPLAHPTLRLLSVSQTGGAPAKAQISGLNVLITPSAGALGVETFSVKATDVASEPLAREFSGTITVQLLGVPGAPGAIQATPGNGEVALQWGAAATNGSAIDSYQLTMDGSRSVAVQGTTYAWRGLQNGQTYSFSVRAKNAQGFGPPTASVSVTPQSLPGAPGAIQATPGNGEVALQWGAAAANGAVVSYQLSVTPVPPGGVGSRILTSTKFLWVGLDNALGPYTFTVTPINKLGPGPSVTSSSVYTFGTPTSPSAPSATGSVSPDQSTTTIQVSWPVTADCNDARPCSSYRLGEYMNGSLVTTVSPAGSPCPSLVGELCQSFGPLNNNGASYTFALQQTNAEGQTSPFGPQSSPAVEANGIPGSVSNLGVVPKNQQIDATFTLPASNSSGIAAINYSLTNESGGSGESGTWSSPGSSGSNVVETVGGLTNGDTYSLSVTVCNAAGECGAASNTASAVPYGPPKPPTLTVTPSGSTATDTLTYSWSGGGDNGRPITSYTVCIDSQCSSYPAPSSDTVSIACGTSTHTATATATDSEGQTSSAATETFTTDACPPQAPTVHATSSGNSTTDSVTYSWSGGGGNGLSYTYNVCTNQGCASESSAGSNTVSVACDTTFTVTATVADTEDQTSSSASYQTTTAQCPHPSVSVTLGSGGGLSSLSWSNFPSSYSGDHTFTCNYSQDSVNTHQSFTYSGTFTGSGSVAGTGGGSGNNLCWITGPASMSVTIDGITSNTVTS